jgi:AcrR family transcriptional regulator
MSTKKFRKPGRPRNESIRIRILETAVSILKRRGYKHATMNEIALRSRVGKQTLYRWWKNRAELLMEALLYNAEKNVDAHTGPEETSSLQNFIARVFDVINKDSGIILRSLVAEGICDKNFSLVFFNTFISKRQNTLSGLIREHASFADKGADTINALVDVVYGAMWYRLIFGHRPLDDKLAAFLSDLVKGTDIQYKS